jgi:hypothetical protein
MASASRVFGNNWQTQPRTILSRNGTRLGLPRRSTMICCRNTRISASNAARGRTRSTTIPKISLQRSNIPQKIIRFCVSRQLDGIYDRDNKMSSPPRRNAPPEPASPGIVRASPGAQFQTAIARASGSSIAECSAPTSVDRSAT